MLYLPLPVYYKHETKGAIHRTSEDNGKGNGDGGVGLQSSHPPMDRPTSQHLDGFTNTETVRIQSLRILMGVSLHGHNLSNHWPLVISLWSPFYAQKLGAACSSTF